MPYKKKVYRPEWFYHIFTREKRRGSLFYFYEYEMFAGLIYHLVEEKLRIHKIITRPPYVDIGKWFDN